MEKVADMFIYLTPTSMLTSMITATYLVKFANEPIFFFVLPNFASFPDPEQ